MKSSGLTRKTPMRRTSIKPKAPTATAGVLRVDAVQRKARSRKCAVKGCTNRFQPRSMAHKACSPACAEIYAVAERKRLEAKQTREKKVAMKPRAQWMKEAQAAVNAYVRTRDDRLPCVSCGRYHEGQYHAGHFLSRGSHPHLALEADNIAKQCMPCNVHLSGNQLNFRKGLIDRIGLARVEALESDQMPRHYTIDDLKRIKAEYKAKLRALREAA